MRLHNKHGLNPTLAVCFWCGKERGDIALLGAAYKGEAPTRMVIDYAPCDACKAERAKGVTLIECSGDEGDPRPTGRWCVVNDAAIRRCIVPTEQAEAVIKARAAYLEVEAYGLLVKGGE